MTDTTVSIDKVLEVYKNRMADLTHQNIILESHASTLAEQLAEAQEKLAAHDEAATDIKEVT